MKGIEDKLGFHDLKVLQDRHFELYTKHITVKKEQFCFNDAICCFHLDSVSGGGLQNKRSLFCLIGS